MKTIFGMGAVSADQLADDCGGVLLSNCDPSVSVYGLATDSSEADAHTAFLALHGKRVDGHAFISNAVGTGCRAVISERPMEGVDALILVEKCENALLRLANTLRRRQNFRAVAVTGSVGKTTTKNMIASVLSESFETFKTAGNHNSTVGMPLSLLGALPKTEWAVLEMGMNSLGEIERLSRCAEPDIAIITNIGTAHIGMLGSREKILQAKSEIFSGLRSDGLFIRNMDDELLTAEIGKTFRSISISAHGKKADFSAKNIRVEPEQTRFDLLWSNGLEKDVCIRVAGAHQVYAALFAFAVGISAGISPEKIRQGLLFYQQDELRQTRTVISGVTLIEDCYNASPESMTAALDVLDTLCSSSDSRGIAVLGDMLELGAQSDALHRAVGHHFSEGRAELLFTIGQGGGKIAQGARAGGVQADRIFENCDRKDLNATAEVLCRTVRRGDIVLIKASRAVAAERVGFALKNFLRKEEGRDHA